ncbi:hypothetical protein Tco_1054850 [Tanacetum coccineum]|uniref:Uncharacterized protein n=1 Tax=Tanacetum coccineum TaxID=301880 RepID=A0ABQ5GXZ3_9ASTR
MASVAPPEVQGTLGHNVTSKSYLDILSPLPNSELGLGCLAEAPADETLPDIVSRSGSGSCKTAILRWRSSQPSGLQSCGEVDGSYEGGDELLALSESRMAL